MSFTVRILRATLCLRLLHAALDRLAGALARGRARRLVHDDIWLLGVTFSLRLNSG